MEFWGDPPFDPCLGVVETSNLVCIHNNALWPRCDDQFWARTYKTGFFWPTAFFGISKPSELRFYKNGYKFFHVSPIWLKIGTLTKFTLLNTMPMSKNRFFDYFDPFWPFLGKKSEKIKLLRFGSKLVHRVIWTFWTRCRCQKINFLVILTNFGRFWAKNGKKIKLLRLGWKLVHRLTWPFWTRCRCRKIDYFDYFDPFWPFLGLKWTKNYVSQIWLKIGTETNLALLNTMPMSKNRFFWLFWPILAIF